MGSGLKSAPREFRLEPRYGARRHVGGRQSIATLKKAKCLCANTARCIQHLIPRYDASLAKQSGKCFTLLVDGAVPITVKQVVVRRKLVVEVSGHGFDGVSVVWPEWLAPKKVVQPDSIL